MTPSAVPVACESRIERVVVYARGAVVTRRVTLPEALPGGPFELRVGGLTALAEPGSVRAIAGGDREVTALKARVVVPAAPAAPGALVERVRALGLEGQRLAAERESLLELRGALGALALDPGLRRWAKNLDPAARFGDALAVHALASAELERLDGLLRASAEALEENRRAQEAADVAAAQGTTAELSGRDTPELEVLIRLGAGAGSMGALSVEYVVRAARWWPAYTARFTAAATRVALTLDAFVAQASGEDWGAVHLALSTADLAHDARLPELRSLRLGRAQPAARRGYRPAPIGLDAMFEGHDRAAVEHRPPATDLPKEIGAIFTAGATETVTRSARHGGAQPHDARVAKELAAALEDHDGLLNEYGAPAFAPPMVQAKPMAVGMAVPMPMSMPPARSAGLLSRMLPSGGPQSTSAPRGGMALDGMAPGLGGAGPGAEAEPEPQAIEPGDAWLDFDTLSLHDASTMGTSPPNPGDHARRGRLVRDAAPAARAGAAVEELAGPPKTCDPLEGRGRFDHRYDAEGTADVPSSGRAHRVSVTSAEAPSTPRFVAVPREVAEVFREAEIQNPFAAPLLAGPVDVFLDGALLTTSPLAFVDRAGWIHLGLGVEERIRIARNARVDESTAGLLGGSAVIDHAVTVDLASSLGQKVTVEVLERVPVTDEKDVEIKISYARPEPERYTQADRGAPVRRGLRFAVEVPAGDKARIELGYRVTLPAKNEIVGGNRRE